MTTNALEKALWQIGTDAEQAERFRDDPGLYASGFRLDPAEQDSLAQLDVGDLARRDVSTLLLMMAHMAVRGPEGMPKYMESMNRPRD